MKKKGQAAMEYLMTYGWAILIIIVVVGALFAMGVFKTESSIACSPCFSDFAFVDYAGGTLVLTNGPNKLSAISINDGTIQTSTPIEPGEEVRITEITTSGDVDLTITYNMTASGLNHTDTATIHN